MSSTTEGRPESTDRDGSKTIRYTKRIVVLVGLVLSYIAGFGHDVEDVAHWVIPSTASVPTDQISVVPSSELRAEAGCTGTCLYGGENVLDGRLSTAWGEGSKGLPDNEYLAFYFAHPERIIEIDLAAGWQRDECTYNRNARPKTVRVSGEGLESRDYSITAGPGIMKLPFRAASGVTVLKVEFTSITAGTECAGRQPADDMLVSEVGFLARTPTLWQR